MQTEAEIARERDKGGTKGVREGGAIEMGHIRQQLTNYRNKMRGDNVATKEAAGNKLLVFEVLIGEFMIYRFVQRDCLIVIVASTSMCWCERDRCTSSACELQNNYVHTHTHTQTHTL